MNSLTHTCLTFLLRATKALSVGSRKESSRGGYLWRSAKTRLAMQISHPRGCKRRGNYCSPACNSGWNTSSTISSTVNKVTTKEDFSYMVDKIRRSVKVTTQHHRFPQVKGVRTRDKKPPQAVKKLASILYRVHRMKRRPYRLESSNILVAY